MATLKQKLRDLRSSKELSLDKLAEKVNMSKSYLWELENRDNVSPSAEKLSKIADALDVTLEYLLDDKTDQPSGEVEKQAFFRKYDNLDADVKKKIQDIMDVWGKK